MKTTKPCLEDEPHSQLVVTAANTSLWLNDGSLMIVSICVLPWLSPVEAPTPGLPSDVWRPWAAPLPPPDLSPKAASMVNCSLCGLCAGVTAFLCCAVIICFDLCCSAVLDTLVHVLFASLIAANLRAAGFKFLPFSPPFLLLSSKFSQASEAQTLCRPV